MDITIIGGGIIGLCSAYSLTNAGHQVTIIEGNECGTGASSGSAGWMVPSMSNPFNAPGAILEAMKSMVHRNGATRFQRLPSWNFLKWAALFQRNSTSLASNAARETLLALNQDTPRLFQEMRKHIAMEVRDDGLLLPFQTPREIDAYLGAFETIRAAGYAGASKALDPQALHTLEPALADGLAGGVHLLDEKSVRPETFTAGLVQWLRKAGTTIVEHTAVRGLAQEPGGWSIDTSHGTYRAEHVVLAAGAASTRVLRTIGVSLPMEGGRGCSITTTEGPALRYPVKLLSSRVACTPFAGGTRYAGTFDFASGNRPASLGRMRSALRAGSAYIPGLATVNPEPGSVFSGLRPSTPDSVPYIGPVPGRKGLLVATGHGTLGLTLGPVTGEAVAALVANESVPEYIRKCALDRPQIRFS